MLRNFFETIFFKFTSSIVNFVIVILTSQCLGAKGRGEISLFVLAISIISLIQNIVGGSSFAYFSNKISVKNLFIISIFWIIFTSFLFSYFLIFFKLLDDQFFKELILISILTGLISSFQNYLIGREKIRKVNWIEFAKTFSLFVLIIVHFFVFNIQVLDAVIHSYLMSGVLTVLVAVFLIRPHLNYSIKGNLKNDFKDIISMGFQMQVNNILQLINYRYTFYVIEKWISIEAVGIVSVAVSIAETIWIICKSASTVLYSKLLNTKELDSKIKLTIAFTKVSYLLTVLALIVLILLPNKFYQFIFGDDFVELNDIILSYSIGVVLLAFFTQLNHFFAALNQNKINILATFIGNVFVISFSFVFIPNFGLIGSGFSISIAYFAMTIFLVFQFLKHPSVKFSSFFGEYLQLKNQVL